MTCREEMLTRRCSVLASMRRLCCSVGGRLASEMHLASRATEAPVRSRWSCGANMQKAPLKRSHHVSCASWAARAGRSAKSRKDADGAAHRTPERRLKVAVQAGAAGGAGVRISRAVGVCFKLPNTHTYRALLPEWDLNFQAVIGKTMALPNAVSSGAAGGALNPKRRCACPVCHARYASARSGVPLWPQSPRLGPIMPRRKFRLVPRDVRRRLHRPTLSATGGDLHLFADFPLSAVFYAPAASAAVLSAGVAITLCVSHLRLGRDASPTPCDRS